MEKKEVPKTRSTQFSDSVLPQRINFATYRLRHRHGIKPMLALKPVPRRRHSGRRRESRTRVPGDKRVMRGFRRIGEARYAMMLAHVCGKFR